MLPLLQGPARRRREELLDLRSSGVSSNREPGYGEALVGPDGKPIPTNPNVRYHFAGWTELDDWIGKHVHDRARAALPTAGRRKRHTRSESGDGEPLFRRRGRKGSDVNAGDVVA